MWKRDEARTTTSPATEPLGTTVQTPEPVEPVQVQPVQSVQPSQPAAPPAAVSAVSSNIGRSVVIKGELTGSQDLTIDGRVEGFIDLREHELTIGPNASIEAEIIAKTVTVFGSVVGNVTAKDLHLRHGGSLEGNVVCTSMAIQDRAHFCGSVDMGKRGRTAADASPDEMSSEDDASRSAAVA